MPTKKTMDQRRHEAKSRIVKRRKKVEIKGDGAPKVDTTIAMIERLMNEINSVPDKKAIPKEPATLTDKDAHIKRLRQYSQHVEVMDSLATVTMLMMGMSDQAVDLLQRRSQVMISGFNDLANDLALSQSK